MSAPQFTPGPWVVCKDDAYVDGSDGKPVAYCRDPERHPSDMSANTRLISAAPDLYGALARIADIAHTCRGKPIGQLIVQEIALHALAKAGGEPNLVPALHPIFDEILAAHVGALAKARGEA